MNVDLSSSTRPTSERAWTSCDLEMDLPWIGALERGRVLCVTVTFSWIAVTFMSRTLALHSDETPLSFPCYYA